MQESIIFAGWATVDITPDKRVNLQGQFHERISEGVHDRIYATVLAIQSKDENGVPRDQAVMISCDLVSVSKFFLDKLRKKLKSRIEDLDTNKILMFATHTHTAPCVRDEPFESFNPTWTAWKQLSNKEYMPPSEYIEFLTDILAETVIEAWSNRQPAKVGIGLGHAVVGHCRRVVFDDRAIMYATPNTANFVELEGPSDHGIELMYFWNMNDKLTGVIINVACPAQVVEMEKVISADYFGAARRKIKEHFSDDVHVLPQISPAGDQSPRDLIRRGKSENIMNSFEGAGELGQRVADACIKGYESAKKTAAGELVFGHIVEDIYLPIRKVTMGEVERAQKEYNDLMKKYGSEEKVCGRDFIRLFNCRAVLDRKEVQEKATLYKMELHALRLGDAVFVTNPFELYIEYGLRIKARSRAKQTFAIQLSCGSGGYLPTRKAISGGSYGAGVSNGIVGPEGGDLLVEHSIAAINRLWGDRGYTEKIRGL